MPRDVIEDETLAQRQVAFIQLTVANDGIENFYDDSANVFRIGPGQ